MTENNSSNSWAEFLNQRFSWIQENAPSEQASIQEIRVVNDDQLELKVQHSVCHEPYFILVDKEKVARLRGAWAPKFWGLKLGQIDRHALVLSIFYFLIVEYPLDGELFEDGGRIWRRY